MAVLGVLTAFLAPLDAVAEYPDRPIKLVVPWPVGATTDSIARVFGQQLSQKLETSVIVENRGGANAIVGTQHVANAAPDGYTIEFTTSEPLAINPHVYKSLPYDVEKDLTAVAFVGRTYFVIAARTGFPADDIRQTIALARQQPGKLTVASYGIADLFLGSFESETGTEFLRVPYQGAGPAVTAVLGGQVDLTLAASFSAAQHLQGGRIKLLAVGSSERLPFIPQVPTFIEQGLAGFQIGNWLALMAPSSLDPKIQEKLENATREIVASPEFVQRSQSMGIEPKFAPGSELQSIIQADSKRWARVVKEKNIPLQ
jgi:tripartite-type tricarboxylate transporter receptor subunit TctC